jgi:tRNA-2-methylthio-N6-dimethylallyladenosine synthase
LSKDETYGDISPVRLMSNGITALFHHARLWQYVYVLCGPFTRGRERSREPQSIMKFRIYGTKASKKSHFWTKCDSYLWYGGGLKKISQLSEIQKQRL